MKNSKDSLKRIAANNLRLNAAALPAAPLIVGGEAVLPGKRAKLDLPAARLTTGTMLSLPVTVINGKKPGPRLWLSAAIHGDELNGVDIIRRVTKVLKPPSVKRLGDCGARGQHFFGLLEQSRYLPDRRDLKSVFPRVNPWFSGQSVSGIVHERGGQPVYLRY